MLKWARPNARIPARRTWSFSTPSQAAPPPHTSFTRMRPLRAGRLVARATDTDEGSWAGCAGAGGVGLVVVPDPLPPLLPPVVPLSTGGGPLGCADAGVPMPVGPSKPAPAVQR